MPSDRFQTQMPEIWGQFASALEIALLKEPNDLDTLAKLAQMRRLLGDLNAAAECYRRIVELDGSDAQSRQVADVLAGCPVPNFKPDRFPCPAPFVRIEEFLAAEDRSRIWQHLQDRQDEFAPLEVSKVDAAGNFTDVRDDAIRRQLGLKPIPMVQDLIGPRITTLLPDLCGQLGVENFTLERMGMTATVMHNGDFGKAHYDNADRRVKIGFLYYLHDAPKQFIGGDLLLYDTITPGTQEYDRDKFSRIPHQDNSLLIFPSVTMHEITEVATTSSEFKSGRFAVTGFLVAQQ